MGHKDIDVQERSARAEAREKEEESAFKQRIEDIKWQMGSTTGRRVMWRLLSDCGVFQTSFTGNSETFFKEGKRDIGLRFLADVMAHCRNEFVKNDGENGEVNGIGRFSGNDAGDAAGNDGNDGNDGADAGSDADGGETQGDDGAKNTEAGSQGEVDTKSLMDDDGETGEDGTKDGDGDGDGTKDGDGDDGKDGDEDGKDDGAPDEYADFDIPEDATLDSELLTEFKEEFKKENLTQEQAQSRVDQGMKLAAKWQENSLKNMQTTIDGWREETRNHKEIGGDKLKESLAAAKEARDTFGAEGFNEVLENFGLGNHPAVIATLVNIRKAVSDDVFVQSGKPTGKPTTPAQRLFGKTHSKVEG